MKKALLLIALIALLINQCTQPLEKPALATVNPVENEYWGISLTDPYQYMENLEDTIVRNWMIANADYARSILDGIPGRDALIEKMQEFDKRVSDRISSLTILDTGWKALSLYT